MENACHELVGGFAHERGPPSDAAKQQGAERIHVRARIDVFVPARLFRCHVGGRPDHGAGHGQCLHAGTARKAVVEELDPVEPPVDEEDVRRLDVTVDDALLVGDAERRRDLDRDAHRLAHAQVCAREARGQVLSLQPLHDEVELVGNPTMSEVSHDAGMPQRRQRFDLALEAIGRGRGPHGLYGHERPGVSIDAAVHHAHTAARRGSLDLEPPV